MRYMFLFLQKENSIPLHLLYKQVLIMNQSACLHVFYLISISLSVSALVAS